ncbi:MAG: hypothetical protein LBG27_09065 [Spirochaetaceae bacterium]|jgi:hypothetical protein|nr:hypothetical protein [Spirochaetaceae bacterium]
MRQPRLSVTFQNEATRVGRMTVFRRALDKTVWFIHDVVMAFFLKQRGLRLILAAYMVFAIMGTFIFVLMESFPEVNFAGDEITQGGVFASMDYAIDCLVESGSLTGKAGKYSPSVARNSFLRISTLAGSQNIEMFFCHLSLKAIEETNHLNKKSSILLNLRI